MKLKTLLSFFLLILATTFSLGQNKSIKEIFTQNKWIWVKGVVTPPFDYNNSMVTDVYKDIADKCYYDNVYTFNPDGTGSVDDGKEKCMNDSINSFTWTLSADEIMLTISEPYIFGTPVLTLARINSEYMILTWHYGDGTRNHFYTDTYKAVK